MPYFKDTSNRLHFIEAERFSYLLPAGCVAITDAEADSIQLAPPTAAEVAKLAALKDAEDTRTLMRALPFTKALAKMTPADLDSYIDANLTNIVDTRAFIKKLSQIVLALVKREML